VLNYELWFSYYDELNNYLRHFSSCSFIIWAKHNVKLCWNNIPPRASQINTDQNNRGRFHPNSGKMPNNHRLRGWEKPIHTHSPDEETISAHACTAAFMRVCVCVRARAQCEMWMRFHKHTRARHTCYDDFIKLMHISITYEHHRHVQEGPWSCKSTSNLAYLNIMTWIRHMGIKYQSSLLWD